MACNGLPPPSCRGGSQEHVRVAWMSGGVLRWQGACARCVGFRQPRVGGRCYRKPPPTAVARVWSGQPKSSIINVRAIGERALRWVLQAVTKTGSRGTPTFHRPARTTGSDGLSVTPQLRTRRRIRVAFFSSLQPRHKQRDCQSARNCLLLGTALRPESLPCLAAAKPHPAQAGSNGGEY